MRSASTACAAGLACFAFAPAHAEPRLVHAGDTDGDGASEVLLVTDKALALRDGPDLAATLWELSGETAGLVITAVGDVDGDGLADLAIGRPPRAPDERGRVTVVFGRVDPGAPRTQTLTAESPGDGFGAAFTGLDLDGDGASELVIGAPERAAPGSLGWVGIYHGLRATDVFPGGVEVSPIEELWGVAGLGARIERVFDADGDGASDLLVASATSPDGEAWLVSFEDDGLRLTPLAEPNLPRAALGDVDGDLRADLLWPFELPAELRDAPDTLELVGAGDFDGDLVGDVLMTTPGRSALVLGAAHGLAPSLAWQGPTAAPIGDVDGDGLADLGLIDDADERLVHVRRGAPALLGAAALVAVPPASLTPAPILHVALSGGPDLDGDGGAGDLAIGLPELAIGDLTSAARVEGALFILPGDQGAPADRQPVPLPRPYMVMRDVPGFASAVATGLFLRRVGVLVGAPSYSEGGDRQGLTQVLFSPDPRPDVHLELGPHAHALHGASVALVGDMNGDGVGEPAIAEPGFAAAIDRPGAGRVLIGAPPSGAALLPRWAVEGDRADMALGVLLGAGDLDGDGHADLVIGAPSAGELIVAQIRPGAAKLSRAAVPDPAHGGSASGFGAALAAADFDGDGLSDLAVLAPGGARVEVFFGYAPPGGGPALDPTRRQTVPIDAAHAAATLSACDLDGDGFGELIVGLPAASEGAPSTGRVDLYRGGPAGLAPTPAQRLVGASGARFGLALAAVDRNLDGRCDLAAASLDGTGAPVVAIYFGGDGARGQGLAPSVSGAPPWHMLGARDRALVTTRAVSPLPGRRRAEVQLRSARADTSTTRAGAVEGRDGLTTAIDVFDLTPDTPWRLAARLTWRAADAPLQPSSRWVHAHPHLPPGVDVRTARNRAPVALDDRYRVGAGPTRLPLDWLLDNDYDVDLDPLDFADFTPLDGGRLEREGATLVFTPPDGTPTERRFTYRVRDAFGALSAPATVTLAVTDCGLAECRDGQLGGTLELPGGKFAGFSCRVRYDLDPPRIECPVDADGELVMGSRACGP